MISREQARSLIDKHIKSPNLRKHMIAVSVIMRSLAEALNEDPIIWELVGLLHDLDYEKVCEDWTQHGVLSAEMVRNLLPEMGLHAIRAHNIRTGVDAERGIDRALIAADAISGLIIATALMMPSKKLAEVNVRSLKKKVKDKSFARNIERSRIMYYNMIGLDYNDFLGIALNSLQSISRELEL